MNKLDIDLTLYDCLVKSAIKALTLQHEDGSMPAGHNGPYFDLETPVRNTGHWLMTFLKVYSITKKKIFFNAAQKALDYGKKLLVPSLRNGEVTSRPSPS